jgi:hypothetical protein
MFCRSLFVLLYFSFGHCLVCSSSIYGFWLPFWYPQTVLNHATFYYSNCNKLGNLAVNYLYVTRVDFGPFCGFAIGLLKFSERVVFFVLPLLDSRVVIVQLYWGSTLSYYIQWIIGQFRTDKTMAKRKVQKDKQRSTKHIKLKLE